MLRLVYVYDPFVQFHKLRHFGSSGCYRFVNLTKGKSCCKFSGFEPEFVVYRKVGTFIMQYSKSSECGVKLLIFFLFVGFFMFEFVCACVY